MRSGEEDVGWRREEVGVEGWVSGCEGRDGRVGFEDGAEDTGWIGVGGGSRGEREC